MPATTPEEFKAQVSAFGPRFDETILGATRDLYRAAATAYLSQGSLRMADDVRYGPDARQRLDIYSNGGRHKPVLVFLHGGGFIAGDKRGDEVFYANLGRYFAEAGFVTVLFNYRLAPAHTWPAGAEDLQSVVDWARDNIADHGGDASQLVLLGQSAGAAHASTYLFDPAFHAHASRHVKAAALLSGVYDLQLTALSPGGRSYFGEDAGLQAERSAARGIRNSQVPLLLTLSEFDPPVFGVQAFALARAVTERDGRSPQFAWFAGHNHVSTVHGLGSVQDDVGQRLRAFFAAHVGAA